MILRISCLLVLISVTAAIAGDLERETPTLPEFAVATPEMVKQILDEARGSKLVNDCALVAVASGRPELIQVCFEHPLSDYDTLRAVAELPESEFKDSLTLRLLKCDSGVWPPGEWDDGSRGPRQPTMLEPFASMVRRLLPGRSVEEEVLNSKAKRLELAEQLKAALGGRVSKIQKSFEGEASTHKTSRSPIGGTSRMRQSHSRDTGQPKSSAPWSLIVVLIVAAGGLLWLLLKRRS